MMTLPPAEASRSDDRSLATRPRAMTHKAKCSELPDFSDPSDRTDAAASSSASVASTASSRNPRRFEPYHDHPRKSEALPSSSAAPTLRKQHGLGLGSVDFTKEILLRRASADANMNSSDSNMSLRHVAQRFDAFNTPSFEIPPTPPSDNVTSKEWSPQVVHAPLLPGTMQSPQQATSPSARLDSPPLSINIPQQDTQQLCKSQKPSGPAVTTESSVIRSRFMGAREIMSLGELPYLNGIRALASIALQFYHIYDEDAKYTNFFGQAALATHFVNGGFLITSSLLMLQSRIRNKGWSHMHEHVPQFFIGRWARLYPALLVVMAINSVWWLSRYDMPLHLTKLITRSMLKIQHTGILDVGSDPPNPFAHTWFLDVQEQFYLFWSLALPLIVPLPIVGRFAVLSSLFCWSLRRRLKTDRDNATLRVNLYKMVAGCALQLIPFPRFLVHRHVRTIALVFFICFVAFGFSPRLSEGYLLDAQRLYGDNGGVILVTLLTLAGISKKQDMVDAKAQAANAEQRGRTQEKGYRSKDGNALTPQQRDIDDDEDDDACGSFTYLERKLDQYSPLALLNSHPLQFIGRISYSWYLWQIPLMHFEDTFHVGNKALGTTAEAFIAAMISTFYIEEPIRNAYQAWRKRQRATTSSLPLGAPTSSLRQD